MHEIHQGQPGSDSDEGSIPLFENTGGVAVIYLSAAGASLIYVFLKAIQQLNVVHHKVWWITPISLGMGLAEVFIIGTVSVSAVQGDGFWPLFFLGAALGLGGAAGALVAMNLHRRVR